MTALVQIGTWDDRKHENATRRFTDIPEAGMTISY